MTSGSSSVFKNWKSTLPASKIIFPSTLVDQFKYIVWRLYTPFHPFLRDLGLRLGIVEHSGRQNFLLGTIAPHETAEELINFLVSRGFGNHFIAWVDDDEVAGLRYVENFQYQYHIRIFSDGEVRAHYEYTPECFPILHFRAVGQEPRREYFLDLLGDKIIPVV